VPRTGLGPPTLRGDETSAETLSKIAKVHDGGAMTYPVTFEANKPMLADPHKIHLGQVLRILAPSLPAAVAAHCSTVEAPPAGPTPPASMPRWSNLLDVRSFRRGR